MSYSRASLKPQVPTDFPLQSPHHPDLTLAENPLQQQQSQSFNKILIDQTA